MKKEDLKSGYVVQLRDGALYMVARVGDFTKILVTPYNWVYLNLEYDNELKCTKKHRTPTGNYQKGRDIVKVYGLIQGTQHYTEMFLQLSTANRELLWEGNNEKEMTLEEIEAELGYKVKIVGGKNDKCRNK